MNNETRLAYVRDYHFDISVHDGTIVIVFDKMPVDCALCVFSATAQFYQPIAHTTCTVTDGIKKGGGSLWLNLFSLNQWRLMSWWGNTAAILTNEDMPMAVEYDAALEIVI